MPYTRPDEGPRRCPTHPSQPLEHCGWCEQAIARAEAQADAIADLEADRAADRYERWLDSLTP